MSNQEDKELMHQIQQKLIGFEGEPPPMAWQAIQQKLNGGAPSMPKNALPGAVRVSAVVALLLGLSVLCWFLQKPKQTTKVHTATIEIPQPARLVKSTATENTAQDIVKTTLKTNDNKIINTSTVVESLPAIQPSVPETESSIDNINSHAKKLEINIKTIDTTAKIPHKHTNFYEKMRQDTSLKKQELFR